jgi:hypothetical protein
MNKNAIADFDAALKINPLLTSSLYGRGLAKQRSGSDGNLDMADAKTMDPNIVQNFESHGGRTTLALLPPEREEIAAIAKNKPNIDLEITFDYNSADISAKSLPSVQVLGRWRPSSAAKSKTPAW